MNAEQLAVKEFNTTFGAPVNETPTMLEEGEAGLRWLLIYEENNELMDAIAAGDLVGVADALGDLLYVVYGAGVAFGIDLEPIFNEIHRSNMTKLGPDGKVLYRQDGKILKPDTYEAPKLEPILEAQSAKIEEAV